MPIRPRPAGLGHALVRDDPRALREVVHLHRKGHGRVEGPDAGVLQRADDPAGDHIEIVARCVELQVGDGASGRAHRLAVHAPDKGDQGPRRRKGSVDERDFLLDRRIVDRDQGAIVRATSAGERQNLIGPEPRYAA